MIKLSIDRPSLLVVIFTVLIVLGLGSYTQLSYELIPKFSAPILTISTLYPGASPSEVENSVTKKIEDQLSSLELITDVNSTSLESFSVTILQFEDRADIDLLLQDAQRKLDQIANELPDDADKPVISKFSSDEFPILNIGATSPIPATQFFDIIDDRVKPALAKIEGVAQITLIGGREREIQVNVRRDKLEQFGLSILQLQQAIQQANLDFPTGKVKDDEQQILIRLAGKFQSVSELENVIVATNQQGAPIRLREVAEVRDSEKDVTDINRVNGQSSIGIVIQKQTDANAVDVSNNVIAALSNLEKQYEKEQVKFAIANNTSDFTIEAVDAVTHDLVLAIVLVAVVMLLFLHSIRNALIVMISIPVSLVTTFIAMYVLDYTFNLMTLLAMSLVIGILVDDSIVVLENIYRHLEMGKKSRKAALDGSREVFLAALAITLVIVVVFVPLALTTGIVGNIMRQFAVVVAVSTLLSLFVSYTITPALASRFSRLESLNKRSLSGIVFGTFERGIKSLTQGYTNALKWSLKPFPAVLIFISAFALFFASFGLVSNGYIGSEFIKNGDRGEYIIQVELAKDARIEETNFVTQRIEEYLFEDSLVTSVFTTAGQQTGVIGGGQSSPNLAEINVKIVPSDQRELSTDIIALQVKNELTSMLPGVEVKSAPVSFFGGADEAPIQVIIASTEIETAKAYADRLLDTLERIQGVFEPELSLEDGNPEINVQVDRNRMAEVGLNMATVGATLQTAFNGNTDAKYKDGINEYDIRIVLDEFDRRSQDDIAELTLMNNSGQLIKLKQFASIAPSAGPARLERSDRLPSVTAKSKVLGVPSGTIGTEVKNWIADNPPPPGVNIKYEGDLKNQAESFGSLGLVFAASFLFVYLIMVALYDSYIYPVVVLLSLPLAMIGALLALALSMETLNIFTILGIIMLIGLVAKNAILLVDFANQAKGEGLTTTPALIQAGQERLRPILMTTISLVIAMVPIAIATGAGAEWKNGLGWVLIGGLTSSMFLTLFVVPVGYQLADNASAFLSRLLGRGKNKDDEEQMDNEPKLEEAEATA